MGSRRALLALAVVLLGCSTGCASRLAAAAVNPCSRTVTPTATPQRIAAAAASLAGGSTLCLARGSYPQLLIGGAHHSKAVTIRSVPGQTATVAGIRVMGSQGLRFSYMRLTEGVEVQDSPSNPGSRDLAIVHDTFIRPLFGVILDGTEQVPVREVRIEHDYIQQVHLETEEVAGDERCNAGRGGQDVSVWGAEGVRIAFNTFDGADWHFIQGGGTGPGGVDVEHNLFEGTTILRCAHLNAWQIWQGGENDVFKHNLVEGGSPRDPVSVIGLIFENGAGGSECSVTMRNVVVEDNLFVNPSTSNVMQVGQVQGLTISHNTGVRFQTGLKLASVCGSSSDVTETQNIMVEGQDHGDEKAGFVGFQCTGSCIFEGNVSSDGSAAGHGARRYVTHWSPSWRSTRYGRPGYYVPRRLRIPAGYRGRVGP